MPGTSQIMPGPVRSCQVQSDHARSTHIMPGTSQIMPGPTVLYMEVPLTLYQCTQCQVGGHTHTHDAIMNVFNIRTVSSLLNRYFQTNNPSLLR